MQTFGEELDIEGFEVDYSVSIYFHGATTLAFLQFFLKNKLKTTTKYFWFQSRALINPLVAYCIWNIEYSFSANSQESMSIISTIGQDVKLF